MFLADTLLSKLIEAIWNRPELSRLQKPIEAALRGDEFKQLTRDAFQTYADRTQQQLPQFFDEAFVTQGPVQDALSAYIVEGKDADLDELLRRYRDYVGADAAEARVVLVEYLGQVRETFAAHPTYGPILLARDVEGIYAALLNFREETREAFTALSQQIAELLTELRAEPAIKAALERKATADQHVFLSYSRADIAFALRLKQDLEAHGHRVWIDTTDIKGGEAWIDAITAGIDACHTMISLVSRSANQSKWVRREYLFAENKGKPIVPVWVKDCDLPIYMMDINAIKGYGEHYDDMLGKVLARLPDTSTGTPPPSLAPVDPRQAYLDRLWLRHKIWLETYTPMAGVARLALEDQKITRRVDAEILPVFKSLATDIREAFHVAPETRKEAFEDIIDAVNTARQLVILGDPGAGKSTTLWKLAADYAESARQDPTAPLPVLVRLGAQSPALSIEQAIRNELDTLPITSNLALLFDGLNELPLERRAEKVAQIRAYVQQAQQHDSVAVVTCREHDYHDDLVLGIPQQVTITPLDPGRIRGFVTRHLPEDGERLFWELAGGDDVYATWQAWERVGASFELFWTATDIPRDNPNVYTATTVEQDRVWREAVHDERSLIKLARNPYMLFMMTEVFAQTGELPQNRGKLFELFVNYLLHQRERLAVTLADDLKNRLAHLAYTMQHDRLGTVVPRQVALRYVGETALSRAVSANLLEGTDDIRFTHQLLQEFFAARQLDQERLQVPASYFWKAENWWEPTGWEETAILLAGLYSDDCTPVLEWLRDANPELTARCVLESGAHTPDDTKTMLCDAWLPRLTDLAGDPRPHTRAAIGRGLGLLDLDNRRGVGLNADGLPDIDWVEIPAGEFLFGSDKDKDPQADDDETPQRAIYLPTFTIARYPVTYRQFQAFIDAEDGFHDPRWWEGLADDDYRREKQGAPGEQAFKYWNHPRERVSWYDAMVFCRWLSFRLTGTIPALDKPLEWPIRLPTEEEWEKAARGTDGRIYPYGNTFDANAGNTGRTIIRRTSTVGIFPQGASPYGVLDMSGNVWEWCLTEYRERDRLDIENSNSRCLRGGSWDYGDGYVRPAFRNYIHPHSRSYGVGFRVIVGLPS